jgi:erythronate-4-phosphate dehydrogenase
MNILVDASLPDLSRLFPKPFRLTQYHSLDQVKPMLADHTILLCRSTLRIDAALLQGSAIQYVATASSGTDHIDHHYLASQHIRLFDAKGSNALAVTDYVTATMAWLEQNITLTGRTAGVIGVGRVGTHVVSRLRALQYDVLCCDPYQAKLNPTEQYLPLEALTACDVLCVHANLHSLDPYPTHNLINHDFLAKLKPGVVLINASRGGIVNECALLNANKPIHYCTDVFLHEPNINPSIVKFATLCTPHIAGHSIEAKLNSVVQLSEQIHRTLNLSPPLPQADTRPTLPALRMGDSWQERLLREYNPYHETQRLKNHPDTTGTFLTQRQAHTTRHDFLYSDCSG